MSNLSSIYYDFLKYPQDNKERLFEAVAYFPFNHGWELEVLDCLDMYLKAPYRYFQSFQVRTNTGNPYNVGPNPHWWFKAVESFLEGCPRDDQIQLNTVPLADEKFEHNYILINPFRQGWDERLSWFLRGTHLRTIFASPSSYLLLCKSVPFLDLCKRGRFDRLIATGEPAFFDHSFQNVLINDKMINWRSGVNFYTCMAEKKHFLPIWGEKDGRYYNLINLCERQGIPVDDLIRPASTVSKCECGRPLIEFKFVPHKDSFPEGIDYDEFLNRKLQDQYFNVQLIQTVKGFMLYYTRVAGRRDDLAMIFPEATLCPEHFCKIGRKRPAIWRCMNMFTATPVNVDAYWDYKEFTLFQFRKPKKLFV